MIIVTQQGTTFAASAPTKQQIKGSYQVTLIGTDGSEWNLNDGPVQLCAGVKLFGTPQVTHWTRSSPAVPGSRWTGFHVDERDVTLPVEVVGGDWAKYRSIDVAFFRALDPSGEVTIRVTSPDGVARTLTCRFVTDGDAEDDTDPLLLKRKLYQLGFIAPQPFWAGPVVRKRVTFTDPIPFPLPVPPPNGLPANTLLYINPPSVSRRTTINNPGDIAAWPRYTVVGPADSWGVGVGASLVTATGRPAVGGSILIDSAPGVRTILDQSGGRQYGNMDSVRFAAVPPGVDVPIVATMNGIGTDSRIDVDLTPLYWRPM